MYLLHYELISNFNLRKKIKILFLFEKKLKLIKINPKLDELSLNKLYLDNNYINKG